MEWWKWNIALCTSAINGNCVAFLPVHNPSIQHIDYDELRKQQHYLLQHQCDIDNLYAHERHHHVDFTNKQHNHLGDDTSTGSTRGSDRILGHECMRPLR
jgi:hypothetical protein